MPALSQTSEPVIRAYDFPPGYVLARKYEVVSQVAAADEGELYQLSERATGIERTGKIFYPQANPRNRVSNSYARKLHRLRHCDILMTYRTQETIRYRGVPVSCLVSDFMDGERLTDFLGRQPGRRLGAFEALHLVYELARGVEMIHRCGEFHGNLSVDRVLVARRGLRFQVKLLDLSAASAGRKPEMIREDVCRLVKIFYEAMGGSRHYAKQPQEIKNIICGLKRSLILERFPNAGHLRDELEHLQW